MTLRPKIQSALAAGALLFGFAANPAGAQAPAAEDPAPPQVQACWDSDPKSAPDATLALCRTALLAAETDEARAMVHLWTAIALIENGDNDAAIAAADQAAAIFPLAEIRSTQALTRLNAGRPDEALASVEAALRQDPQAIELRRARAQILTAMGRGAEGIEDLERLHRELPDDLELTLNLVAALDSQGQTRRRDQILNRAIARAPEAADLLVERALLLMLTRPERSVTDLDVAIAQAPTDEAHALRSFARIAAGDVEGAKRDLAAIGDLATLSVPALVYASFAAETAGDLDGALALAEQLVESSNPTDRGTALARRGTLLIQLDDLTRAKADLERAVILDPEEAIAWGGLGALAMETDPAQAVVFYRRAHALDPDDANLEHSVAEALYWSGDYPGAAAGYSSLLKRYPDNPEMHASLAATLVRMERVQDAERPSARAVALAPDYPEYMLIRGEVLYLLGEEDGALEQLDRLAAAGADTAYSRYVAAVIRRGQADYEAALRETDAGLALAPDNADLMEEKGGVYYMLDDPLSALEWLDKALAINPKLPGALYVRGLVRAELGDAEGAAADQAAAIALNPALAEDL
ncbi:MAG: tetratricopeptide repeat protein [Phenylobacterium sp.]|nr:tetratricopeptide repeat protein [Phenylobacterium sp.]